MDCTNEKYVERNVFSVDIISSLVKILHIYMTSKRNLSPDEFCILIFARKEVKGKCKFDSDPISFYLKIPKDFQIPSDSIQNVIVDLFMNIIRYEVPLEAASKDFLNRQRSRNYDDLHLILVFIYILIYRISTLSFEESLDCFLHFKLTRISSLVSYLLDDKTINVLYKKGCSVFDEEFVEMEIVLPFMEATPCLEELYGRLKEEKKRMKKPKKNVTIPLFMNVLNRPKKLSKVPPSTPEDFTVRRFIRDIPKTNYTKPLTEKKLASLRAANKLRAINLSNDANKKAPTCWRRSKNVSKLRKPEEQLLRTHVRKPAPTIKPVEVKQTAASILRECARVVSEETKEVMKLKELTEGGFDPSSIQRLEQERREESREEELRRMQECHLSALLSRDGAFIAKQSLLDDIKSHTENARKEKRELYEKLKKWRQQHSKEMAEIVVKCREIEQASREACVSMIDEKRRKAAEVSQESRQLKSLMCKQREEETRRKIRLIQEIKMIQSFRSLPFKEFDPTESSGVGLLCEMSLAELKERLFWTKMKLKEDIENRRTVIHRERERQKNLIKDTQKALKEYKADKSIVSSSKVQRHSAALTSPNIQALRKKLEERRVSGKR